MSLRITQRSLSATTTANLQRNLARLQRTQDQLSSGRQLQRPSDSPTGTVAALGLRADLRRGDQLLRNADDGIGWLGTADGALTQSLEGIGRVRELVLRGRNGSMSDDDRAAIASEVEGLRAHLLGIANTRYLGRPLFGGTTTGTDAYAADGSYLGDGGQVSRAILPGVDVPVSATGPEVFGAAGSDLFALLDDIAAHLRTDPSQLDADLAALDQRTTTVKTSLSQVGARYHQIESMRDRTDAARLDAQGALGEVESVDVAEASTQLALQELAYQAALAATARILQPSLLDFLR
jgi:flagellar hook-associated protein 3 FlgL